jgi:enoyl-CoA hydratase
VHYETDGPVAVVTLDRPRGRERWPTTADELTAAFRRFDADDAPAVAELTGAGGRF